MDLLKKLGSLLSCYEDIRRRIQLSYAAFSNIRQVWFKENRHLENKFMLYKSLVKPVLTYSFGAWGLTMIKAQEIDIVQTVERQLRIIIKNFKINNMKLYEQCKEEPIMYSNFPKKHLQKKSCHTILKPQKVQRSTKEKQARLLQFLFTKI